MSDPAFTLGIEEEYLLVDRVSRDLVADPSPALFEEAQAALGLHVSPEFMRSQIEIGTGICSSLAEARSQLKHFRGTLAEVTAKHGLAIVAASTHPFADWGGQKHTDKERYNALARDIGGPVRRLLICGMHVHIGIEDPELRIDLMSQASYFLPHLLALSTSSPFWRGADTGLKSYRLAVFNELPRTGLPEIFDSFGEYQRHLDVLISAGLIEDGSKIWWDLRPSARFPTLEMRISDACTLLEDTLSIAAMYRCILRMLYRLRRSNQRWRRYNAMLINENRWRAQRYGLDEGLVDFGKGRIVPMHDLIEELIDLLSEDAAFFGCSAELAHARVILQRGTSAHRQLAVYTAAIKAGLEPRAALQRVVDRLIEETTTF
ncbi:carboxylate-amine ligase [Dongia rigui]|uniref:Putative glutamate--cysteine ligase 2 n=1 Tax=Dongia rigui TaxID=940149 RepID=A0ABU5DUR0_9PROT|nr:carboxylate-amine ligase [Dongia rigui]MDY0871046.1 carboxylate-amine ligase [Dongia rigui]